MFYRFSCSQGRSLFTLPTSQQRHLLAVLVFFSVSIIFHFCPTAFASSRECASIEAGESYFNLDETLSYFEDSSGLRSVGEIQDNMSVSWLLLDDAIPSFGFSSSAYWLKFDLCRLQKVGDKAVLEISYPLLDSIHLYAVSNKAVIYDEYTGDTIPFSKRSQKHRNFLFFLPDFDTEILTIYIRVQTESAVQVPLKLYSSSGFFEHNQNALFLQGCYFGIILAMIFYNAFLFFSLRESAYLMYVFFTISYFSFQAVLQGFFQQFFFGSVWWQNHALLLFGFTSILFANLFADLFLNLSKKFPSISKSLRSIGIVAALAAVLASALPYTPMVRLMLVLAIPSSMLILMAGLKLWWSGHLPARIFTIAWLTLLLSFVLASFSKFGLLPRVFWTENIMQIGGVLEVLLLSIALGERINEEKRQRILVEQNLSSSLEEMVQARTLALNQALDQLEEANIVLDKISLTDSLTQIANRRAFDNQIEIDYRSAKRENLPLALILIDIDYFKKINDSYGHQVGDNVLQVVAQSLSSKARRPRDGVFRYGGEEFAVLLNHTTLGGAKIVAEKMRGAIEGLQLYSDEEAFTITISAGVSVYNPAESTPSAYSMSKFIHRADTLLYRAKAKGRNRVEVSLGSMSET